MQCDWRRVAVSGMKNIAERHPFVAAVIVSHNSEKTLAKTIEYLNAQSRRFDRIIIVDSGSTDTGYLLPFTTNPAVELILSANVGFAAANNRGTSVVFDVADFVVYVNPDAFLERNFIETALHYMNDDSNQRVGCLTGLLSGYDIDNNQATGLIDSTGIIRTRWGRLVDRYQGVPEENLSATIPEHVPAVCGALMFCRMSALRQVATDGKVFDEDFFMYKEDIELSWRLRQNGWSLLFLPQRAAFHCRGWRSRRAMSRRARVLSAQNELLLYRKHDWRFLPIATLKYLAVRLLDL